MLIVDSNLDLAWNALQWNRDLLLSVYTIRTQERSLKVANPGSGLAMGTVALPEMRRARIAVSLATLLVRSTGRTAPHIDFSSVAQTYGIAQGQLAYYKALAREGHARIVVDLAGLNRHVAEWEAWDAQPQEDAAESPPLGFVISMESADAIASPDQLEEWWDAGVRVIGPAHYGPGRYAGGTGTELGLSDIGSALLAEMERLGVILDLTHFSDRALGQALERFGGPVLVSHGNCRALVRNQRQFSDEHIRTIAARGGVIGVMLDAAMLREGWIAGQTSNAGVTLAKLINHIDHICQLTGSCRHVGIGSDLDGGYGLEQTVSDLDTIADLEKVGGLLAERGYTADDIAGIMHGNWLALLRTAWR